MAETVRESINRGLDEIRSRDGGEAPAATERPEPHMADFHERLQRREHIDDAKREVRAGAPLQADLDKRRRDVGEARGFERMRQYVNGDPKSSRMPTVRPDGRNPTVRESFYAAIEELKQPEPEVSNVDRLTGKATVDLIKGVDYVDNPPDHWQGVHPQEFHGLLSNETRAAVKEHATKRQEFEGWKRSLTDPKTANAALGEIMRRFPITDAAQAALVQKHIRTAGAKMARPALPWMFPPGFTAQSWSMIPNSSRIRDQAKGDAETAFYYDAMTKLLNNPATRGEAYCHLFDNFAMQGVREAIIKGGVTPAPAQEAPMTVDQARGSIKQWAADKPHFDRQVPYKGGTAQVGQIIGAMITAQMQTNPQVIAAYGNDYARMISDAYAEVVKRYGLDIIPEQKAPKAAPAQRKRSTSMKGSAPDAAAIAGPPPAAPNRVESARDSIKRALAELRS